METIYGYLERISYCNEESNFVVAKLKEKGKRELSSIVGNMVGVNPGESLQLTGRWLHNPKFGLQFQVDSYETIVPATVRGMEKYLGSGLIKGIGPVMAKRIVQRFGVEALDIIEKQPDRLQEVNGIGPKRVEMITQAWEEQREVKEIMIFLQGHGVAASYAAKIYQRYEKEAIQVVKENPYRLAAEVRGIGFLTADRIAQQLGIDPNSLLRAREGIVFVLNQYMNDGHVYCPRALLLEKAEEALQITAEVVEQALEELLRERRLAAETMMGTGADGEAETRAIYLMPFFIAELQSTRLLLALQEEKSVVRPIDVEKAVDWVGQKLKIKLAARQKEAVATAVSEKIMIITGGPGTGKTTIVNAITRIFAALKLKITMAAPTGRAARRLRESTGLEAMTIHRLLEFSPREGGFARNRENPLNTDVVIVDESSMIDSLLMYNLLKAIPPQAILILVGDVNQLPSVGPGNVLQDLIESGRFPVIELTDIFRQAKGSRIVYNAHRINQGKFPFLPEAGEESDFYFMEEKDAEKALQKILGLCRSRIPRYFNFHPIRDIQVLTPMNRGLIGVSNLNVELQQVLNPRQPGISRGGRNFKIGDKVMQLVNNYDKGVYNGDIGWVKRFDVEEQELEVEFEDYPVSYDFSQLDELQLAYACSIHKAQGSEYPAVIIPLLEQHYILLQRNLLYTGVTRARKLVIIIGSKKALHIAINNDKPRSRDTGLKERLMKMGVVEIAQQ
ncbi:SF1B family DNA helicase RecD2 [Syntrophomonas wolfei]|uniref:SF1B family DNA helicase RecD2 n=2 Tax=Syntrophomonas wolfei TaxID=863 RepID=UPI000772E703|nr:ATP-dependent RecD-like DNA helicase [Syntrophomonas wolfei]